MLLKLVDFNKLLNQKQKRDVFSTLSIFYKPQFGIPIKTKVYKLDISTILLPRRLCEYIQHDIFNNCETFEDVKIMKNAKVQLRDNDQQIISDLIYNKLTTDGTMVLNLRAGAGKTFIAADVITRLQSKTLFIVPKQALAVQAKKDLSVLSDYKVVQYDTKWATKNKLDDVDIAIVVINTALKQDESFFSQFGFVVFDEVHEYVSQSRREIFWKTRNKYILGMSATTDHRTDGLDHIYKLHLGKVVYGNDLISEQSITNGYDMDVEVIEYSGPPEHTKYLTHEKTGKVFMPYIIDQLMKDKSRWNMLKSIIKHEYYADTSRNIYVFCATLAPLEKLYAELELPDCGLFVGGISKDEITRIQNECRVILTTYGYASTGVSIVKMNTIIFATPQVAKMGQIVPRILRTGGDTTIKRKVIDIVDVRLSFLVKQHTKRMECYKTFNPTIEYAQAQTYSLAQAFEDINLTVSTDNKVQKDNITTGIFEVRYKNKVLTNFISLQDTPL